MLFCALRTLVWCVSRLRSLGVVPAYWVLLSVASCLWCHQNLHWIVRVSPCLALYRRMIDWAHVVPALDCHLLLRSQNVLKRTLFLHSFSFFCRVLLSRWMLGWNWIFCLNITWRNSFLLIWSRRIPWWRIFCRNVTWIAGLCVPHETGIVVKRLSRWCLFRDVLRNWPFDFFILGWEDFFVFILFADCPLFSVLIWMLRPSDTSFNTFSYVLSRLNRDCIHRLWDLLFIGIQLFNSLINEPSILFQVQFSIVTDWRVNDFVRNCLFFRLVEWSQVRMFQYLSSCWPFLRVDWKHWSQEVQSVLRYGRFEPFIQRFLFYVYFVYHGLGSLWI